MMNAERHGLGAMRAANLLLAGAGGLCALAFLYFLYHYTWTGNRQFTSAFGPLIYYVVPAALSALFFLSLRLRPRLKARLTLATTSTVLILVAAELFLEAARPAPTIWSIMSPQEQAHLVRTAQEQGITYDTRGQAQVVIDLRAKGVDAVPFVFPHDVFVPQQDGSLKSPVTVDGNEIAVLGAISGKTTVFCNEDGHWLDYQSDEHGFRNPPGIWSSPSVDVAVIGDSFGHGMCVAEDRSLTGLIRKRYPSLLNLAISSTGPVVGLADLHEYAAQFRPKLVLWFFYEENDFADLRHERKSPVLMRYLTRGFSQGLRERQAEIDGALGDWATNWIASAPRSIVGTGTATMALPRFVTFGDLRERLHLVLGAEAAANGLTNHRMVTPDEVELLAQILSDAKTTVNSWGGSLYLVYLPERERYTDYGMAKLDETIREHVRRTTRSLQIPMIDVHPAFEAHGDPVGMFPFRLRGHYNEAGFQLAAETVLRSLPTTLVSQ